MSNRFIPRGHAEKVMRDNGDMFVIWVPDEPEHRERFERARDYAGNTRKQDLGDEISRRLNLVDGGVLHRWSQHHWQLLDGNKPLLDFWSRRDGQFTWRIGMFTERGNADELGIAIRMLYE